MQPSPPLVFTAAAMPGMLSSSSVSSSVSGSLRKGAAQCPSPLRFSAAKPHSASRPLTHSLHALEDPHSVATTSLFGGGAGRSSSSSSGATTTAPPPAPSEVEVLRAELAALRNEVAHLNKQQELGNRLLAQEMKR